MRTSYLLAAAAFAATAVPASATITWSTNQALGQGQTIQLTNSQTVTAGDILTGFTNQTNTQIDFTSTEDVFTQSAGQAKIFPSDGSLNNLTFYADDPLLGFGYVEFNLFCQGGPSGCSASGVTLSGIDDQNQAWSQFFGIGNGENFFSALASGGEIITSVTFNTSGGGVTDFRQLRLDVVDQNGNSLPEPSTWATMLLGFGGMGLAIRRSRKKAPVPQLA